MVKKDKFLNGGLTKANMRELNRLSAMTERCKSVTEKRENNPEKVSAHKRKNISKSRFGILLNKKGDSKSGRSEAVEHVKK